MNREQLKKRLLGEIKEYIRLNCDFDNKEEMEDYIEHTMEWDYTNDLEEVNEDYGMSLKNMVEFNDHFNGGYTYDRGSHLITEDGYLVRFGYEYLPGGR